MSSSDNCADNQIEAGSLAEAGVAATKDWVVLTLENEMEMDLDGVPVDSHPQGTVVAVGPDVEAVEPGDRVVYIEVEAYKYYFNGMPMCSVSEESILMVF